MTRRRIPPRASAPPAGIEKENRRETSAAGGEEAERTAFVLGLREQVRNGVYRPDVRDLALALANMVVRDS